MSNIIRSIELVYAMRCSHIGCWFISKTRCILNDLGHSSARMRYYPKNLVSHNYGVVHGRTKHVISCLQYFHKYTDHV